MPAVPFIVGATALISAGTGIYSAVKGAESQDQALDSQRAIEAAQVRLAQQQDARSQELFDMWKEMYGPLEEMAIQEVQKGPTDAWISKTARDTKDINEQFDQAQESAELALSSAGVVPAPSGKYPAAIATIKGMKERAEADAISKNKEEAELQWYERLQNLINVGRGLPTSSIYAANSAQSGLRDAGYIGGNILSNLNQQETGVLGAIESGTTALQKILNNKSGIWTPTSDQYTTPVGGQYQSAYANPEEGWIE